MATNRRLLEFQADRIEMVLQQHRIAARVTGGTVAPRWIQFKLLPALGTRVSQVTGLARELALGLGVEACRIDQKSDGLTVEIPNPDPRPVRLLPMQQRLSDAAGARDGSGDIPFGAALVGLSDDGAPLLIRLPSPQVAHVLVAGTTGSGKTTLAQSIVASLALRHRASELGFVLVDPKRRAFALFDGLPHLLRPVLYEPAAAADALRRLVALMVRRDHQGVSSPRVVVVVDELVDLLISEPGAEEPLMRLGQRGREAGIHLVACTQKPAAAVIGGLLKANFPVRLVGQVTSPEDAKVATGYAGTGAENLRGPGDFIAVRGGQVTRFQAACVTKRELAELVAQIRESGQERSAVEWPESRPPVGQVAADKVAGYVERVRAVWPSLLKPDGSLKWGAKAELAEIIYGVRSTAGNYGQTVNDVIRRLRGEEKEAKNTTTTDPKA